MKIRVFKTYSKAYGYYAVSFLPTFNLDYLKNGEKQISFSWFVWAMQIKWDILK